MLCDKIEDVDNEEFVEPRRGSTKISIIQSLSSFNRTRLYFTYNIILLIENKALNCLKFIFNE